jgi:hypothetical protein
VIRICGALESVAMAGEALRGKPDKLSNRSAFVTLVANSHCVRADQREPVLVLLHFAERDPPAFHRVALLALRAELAAVDIRVAISALGAHVGKHEARVAQAAFHFFVEAAQRKAGFVVVEFRDIANRPPARESVAVLALLPKIAVRAARGAALQRR